MSLPQRLWDLAWHTLQSQRVLNLTEQIETYRAQNHGKVLLFLATGLFRGGWFNDPVSGWSSCSSVTLPQRSSLIVWHLEAKSIAHIQEDRDLQALVGAALAPMPVTLVPQTLSERHLLELKCVWEFSARSQSPFCSVNSKVSIRVMIMLFKQHLFFSFFFPILNWHFKSQWSSYCFINVDLVNILTNDFRIWCDVNVLLMQRKN